MLGLDVSPLDSTLPAPFIQISQLGPLRLARSGPMVFIHVTGVRIPKRAPTESSFAPPQTSWRAGTAYLRPVKVLDNSARKLELPAIPELEGGGFTL